MTDTYPLDSGSTVHVPDFNAGAPRLGTRTAPAGRRVARGTAARLSVTLHNTAGVATDAAGDVTVAITRDSDGATSTATATGDGAGVYHLDLYAGDQLDVLDLAWTCTLDGVEQTHRDELEVVGGHCCSLDAIDASLATGGDATYDAVAKALARDVATHAIEGACGSVFSPRYARRALTAGRHRTDQWLITDLALGPAIRTVRAVLLDGRQLSDDDVERIVIDGGSLYRQSGWPTRRQAITVHWEHGPTTAPIDISRAVALLAASLLKDGPFDDRGYGVTDDSGFVRLLTAGVGGAMFSVPEIEATVRRHRMPVFA